MFVMVSDLRLPTQHVVLIGPRHFDSRLDNASKVFSVQAEGRADTNSVCPLRCHTTGDMKSKLSEQGAVFYDNDDRHVHDSRRPFCSRG